MRNYLRKLLEWFKVLVQQLTRFFVHKPRRDLVNKKRLEIKLEKPRDEPSSSSARVELRDEQVPSQTSSPTEIDTPQKLPNYPLTLKPEILADKPFESKSEQTSSLTEIDNTRQKPSNYPPLPRRELLVDRPFELKSEQTSSPTEIDTPQKSPNHPLTPKPEILVDRSFEAKSEQASFPTEIDIPRKSPDRPLMPKPEILVDKSFELKLKDKITDSSLAPAQRETPVARITPQPSLSGNETKYTDISSRKRPYIKCGTDELKRIANSEWSNPKILNKIYHELKFRSRKKAQDLLVRISRRLTELQGTKTFVWPTTTATAKAGLQDLSDNVFKYEEGLLKRYGYRVGINGLPENQRRQILNNVFLNSLPSMENTSYLNEWGQPGSAKRLKKLTDSISAFTRNAKRRNIGSFDKAIQDWEADLAYLKCTYSNILDRTEGL